MGSFVGKGGSKGPSLQEQQAVAKANWQSYAAEKGSITRKFHGLVARLAAGGGQAGDSKLRQIYEQQYQGEMSGLKKSQRYRDLGEYYNKMTSGTGLGFMGRFVGKKMGGKMAGGVSKLGMEDWYTFQYGSKKEKEELQPRVEELQVQWEQEEETRQERMRQRQERMGTYEG